MSSGTNRREPAGAAAALRSAPEPLLTRPVALLLLITLGAFIGFSLLLSVVPLYVTAGGASSAGAGFATGALMLSTVASQLQVPRLVARLGYRAVLALGLTLLGAPVFLLSASPALPAVVGVSLARGVGFGILTVVGSALVAELVPARRRGEGVGLYGLAVGLPTVVGLPLGVWLSRHAGYSPVFVAGAVAPLAALAAVPGIRVRRPAAVTRQHGVVTGLRRGDLARPFTVLGITTMASGVIVTFVPLAVPDASAELASAALFAQSAAATAMRWLAGVVGDRLGARRLLVPGTLAAATGMLGAVQAGNPLALVAGMALFGVGFGTLQNVTLVLMFARVPRFAYGPVSAQWNLAYDGGMGLGATGFGIVVEHAGFGPAFALTATLLFVTLGLSWLDVAGQGRQRR